MQKPPFPRRGSDARERGAPEPLDLAASVILLTNRERPADAALREELKRRRVAPETARETAGLVYSYFRWLGWLEPKGLVRKRIVAAAELASRFAAQPESFTDDEIAGKAVPEWLREHVEVSPAWARALQREPLLWLRAKRGAEAEILGSLEARRREGVNLPGALVYEGTTDLFSTPEYGRGLFEVQDLSSQIVGRVCAPRPGETWWDACAGEGGKTLHLSDLMENKGLIWASDRAEWRLRKLKTRAGRAGAFNYRSAVWDGSAKLPTRTKFDGILIDAPCSGIGTWQRNPHARWTTTAQDVEELAALQKRLLAHAAPALKPGGKLVYSVCTLARAETSALARWLTESNPDLEPLPIENPLRPASPPAAELFLWPQDSGGNGMFIAAWKRRDSAPST